MYIMEREKLMRREGQIKIDGSIISDSDVGHEENKAQPCDGECQSGEEWPLYSECSGRASLKR